MIYVGFTFLIIFLSFSDFSSKEIRNQAFFVVVCCLIIFTSIRFNVGSDDIQYRFYFSKINNIYDVLFKSKPLVDNVGTFVEPLYLIINSIIKYFINDAQFVFITIAVISISIRAKVYAKLSPYPIVALLVYASHEYYVKDWIQIRNGVSSSIVLLLLIPLINLKRNKFYKIIILASGFHILSLLAMPLWYFKNIFQKRKILNTLLLLCILFSLFAPFKRILLGMSEYGIVPSRVVNYLLWDEYGYSLSFTSIIVLKAILFTFIFINVSNTIKEKYKYYNIVLAFHCFGTFYLLVFREFAILAVRANGLFYTVEAILLTYLIGSLKNKSIGFFLVIMYCLLYVLYDQFLNKSGIGPFVSVFKGYNLL